MIYTKNWAYIHIPKTAGMNFIKRLEWIPHVVSWADLNLKRIIDLAEEGIYPDNLLPSVVPSEAHSYSVLDYNFIWLELLDFYFFQTKDKDFIYGKTNIIKGLIENFKKYTDKDGLLISKPGKRLFLDWSLVSRNEPNAIYNLHYLYFLQKSQKIFLIYFCDRGVKNISIVYIYLERISRDNTYRFSKEGYYIWRQQF